ncbi:hypothetical protein L1047_04890 [Synechococcus sp. Nb3U1]|uniref:hypothetical protein n=1 Tax=Synechococcus sp. Nb3U1 TaxID=1914529 RepID=UPI001F481FC2|nr:hypothetical protein [Synechococcus sp. Nb3U1]MCF2970531.1 hypothetical protein [Synechococcus sp. Nb3U1]
MLRSAGLFFMALSLSIPFGVEANAQSLGAVNRASQLQLNIGAGRGGSPAPVGASGSVEDRDASTPSAQRWAEWHIRANVCTGNLSTEELAELFPLVDQALVDTVCQRGS